MAGVIPAVPASAVASAAGNGNDAIIVAKFQETQTTPPEGWTSTGSAFDGGLMGNVGGTAGLPAAHSHGRAKIRFVRGAWKSPLFPIARPFIQFKVAGGNHAFRDSINLWIGGRIVRTSTGGGRHDLAWRSWDVTAWRGCMARIEIVDTLGGPAAGHNIRVAEIRQASAPLGAVEGDVTAALASAHREAQEDVAAAAARDAGDSQRPVYHFRPPAQPMNDPNGTFFTDGWYQVFYQFDPFANSPGPGCKMWGHARSRDLVHWENLPIALWPDWEHGEMDCFSGGALLQAGKPPRLFYTSLPAAGVPRSQWSAVPVDSELLRWRRDPARPVLDFASQDGPPVDPMWRDPFTFQAGGRTFMVLASKNVLLYEAADASLARWTYRGVLYGRPGLDVECPNFFPLGDRWMLLMSPKGPVEYVVGAFNPATAEFRPETTGLLNGNAQYYATNVLHDALGRVILFGWIRCKGGCLALPRVLSLGSDDRPRMAPVPELQRLRMGSGWHLANMAAVDRRLVLPAVKGDTLEIIADIDPGDARACGLRVRCSADGSHGVELRYADGRLYLPHASVALEPQAGHLLLHLFLDKSVMEIFAAGGRVAEVRVIRPLPANLGVEFFAEGGRARLTTFKAWPLAAAEDEQLPWGDALPAGDRILSRPSDQSDHLSSREIPSRPCLLKPATRFGSASDAEVPAPKST